MKEGCESWQCFEVIDAGVLYSAEIGQSIYTMECCGIARKKQSMHKRCTACLSTERNICTTYMYVCMYAYIQVVDLCVCVCAWKCRKRCAVNH